MMKVEFNELNTKKTEVKIIKSSEFNEEFVPKGARVEVGIHQGEEIVKITYLNKQF